MPQNKKKGGKRKGTGNVRTIRINLSWLFYIYC